MSAAPRLAVLQMVRNLDIGGAQQVVVTLAKYLAAEGHRPVVCSFRDGPLRSDLEALGIPVVLVRGRRRSVLALHEVVRGTLRIRRALIEIVQRHRIDVVQTHLLRSLDFLVATLPRRGGRPVVYWTFHNYNFTLRPEHVADHQWLLRPKRLAYRWLYRWLSGRVDGLIAVSDEVRSAILDEIGAVDDRVVVIPNGVDVERHHRPVDTAAVRAELGFAPDDVVLVMVGTFKRQKGHSHLIEALSRLRGSHPELRILLVGDGPLRAEVQDAAHRARLDGMVRFLGSRRDIPRILAASDCFVLPSLWEGLPIALLEAMASGLPCIATEVSGTEQVVVDDVTGMLIPPGDPFALAKAMEQMVADPERARRMGAAGRQRIETLFSARKQTRDHVDRFVDDLRTAG
jgi:glycosyltransferase involved in cell wall biosynthesis